MANLIAESLLPVPFVDSQAFKNFMKIVEPGYTMPSSETSLSRLKAAYDNKKEHVEKILESASSVCLTSDCWTSRMDDSYLSVRVNLIDNEWVPRSYMLATDEISQTYSAENFAEKMSEITE